MNCKKCGGNLIRIAEDIVQCENCGAKFRIKSTVKPQTPPEEKPQEPLREIDHTKPFFDATAREIIDEVLDEGKNDTLNRTFDDNVKSRAVLNSVEPEVQDYQSAQDVNDVITVYEQENYPETRDIMEKVYCSGCGKPVDLKTGICPSCGTVMPIPEKMTIVCPFCFYDKNNIYSEFCFKCGRDLEPERQRLGIELKQREHKNVPQEVPKKKSDIEDGESIPPVKKFMNFFGIVLAVIELFVLFTFDFVANSELSIGFGGIIDVLQGNAESNLITEALTNSIFGKVLGLVLLLFMVSVLAYIFGSIYFILVKKSILSSVSILSVVSMISNMVLLVIAEYISFKAFGGIKIELFSPIVNLVISIIVMFVSFMII